MQEKYLPDTTFFIKDYDRKGKFNLVYEEFKTNLMYLDAFTTSLLFIAVISYLSVTIYMLVRLLIVVEGGVVVDLLAVMMFVASVASVLMQRWHVRKVKFQPDADIERELRVLEAEGKKNEALSRAERYIEAFHDLR